MNDVRQSIGNDSDAGDGQRVGSVGLRSGLQSFLLCSDQSTRSTSSLIPHRACEGTLPARDSTANVAADVSNDEVVLLVCLRTGIGPWPRHNRRSPSSYLRLSAFICGQTYAFLLSPQRPLPNQPATQCRLIQFVNRYPLDPEFCPKETREKPTPPPPLHSVALPRAMCSAAEPATNQAGCSIILHSTRRPS
jgi:hypothetical protein